MMKTKLIALEKRLLPELPSFKLDGRLMFLPPIKNVLRGIHFEGSRYNEISFHVTVFVMPLCVPTEHLYFNFGERIRHDGGGDRWNLEMPNLVAELGVALKARALPFLARVESLLDFVEVANLYPSNQRTLEGIGFALARAGRTSQAIETFDRLLKEVDFGVDWQRDLAEQANALRVMLIDKPTEAQEKLAAWETETVDNLGLSALVDNS